MKELTCGRIFNNLLFCAAGVKYIVLTSWPSIEKFRVSCTHSIPSIPIAQLATLKRQISSGSVDRFILLPVKGEKPQVLRFRIQHPVVAPPSSIETTLSVSAQPQTNNIKTTSKFEQATRSLKLCRSRAWRTNRRNKKPQFWFPRRRAKSEPYQTWHGDRGPWARSCISKTHSFAATERLKFGSYHTHRCSVSPLQVEKPQNCPLMFRAVLVVTNKTQHFSHPRQGA